MTRLEHLTPDQTAALTATRDQWLNHGLATGPADRPTAEAGVADAYRAAGLEPPAITVWLNSPIAGAIGAHLLTTLKGQVGGQVRGQVEDQVRGQVRGQVWGQVEDQVRGQVGGQVGGQVEGQVRGQVGGQVEDQVGGQVRGQVRGQVWGQVEDQVRGQVGGQVEDQVRGQVWGQVEDQVRQQIHRAVWGQHDAGWLSFYDYFRTHTPAVAGPDRLAGLIQVAQSAGWWWPFNGAVVLTERPTVLHRDGQGRLHCTDGPAMAYPDGFAIWAWHGTRVPSDLIAGKWDLPAIFAERNAEVRRCAIERLGWDRFIQDSGLTKIASAPDPGNDPYHLALYDLPEQLEDLYDEPARILLCVNGTPEADGTRHRFGLPVPAHHTDPVAAAAELYGWPEAAYRQLQVRR